MSIFCKLPHNLHIPALLLSLGILTGLSSCSKEENPSDIPVVVVNFVISPNSPEYIELNGPGGWVYLTGGYRGIIIYRKSMTEFMAYERACPHDWQEDDARVLVEASGLTAVCPACNSKYILIDGTPFEGPTTHPLKQYQTSYDGNLLYVSN